MLLTKDVKVTITTASSASARNGIYRVSTAMATKDSNLSNSGYIADNATNDIDNNNIQDIGQLILNEKPLSTNEIINEIKDGGTMAKKYCFLQNRCRNDKIHELSINEKGILANRQKRQVLNERRDDTNMCVRIDEKEQTKFLPTINIGKVDGRNGGIFGRDENENVEVDDTNSEYEDIDLDLPEEENIKENTDVHAEEDAVKEDKFIHSKRVEVIRKKIMQSACNNLIEYIENSYRTIDKATGDKLIMSEKEASDIESKMLGESSLEKERVKEIMDGQKESKQAKRRKKRKDKYVKTINERGKSQGGDLKNHVEKENEGEIKKNMKEWKMEQVKDKEHHEENGLFTTINQTEFCMSGGYFITMLDKNLKTDGKYPHNCNSSSDNESNGEVASAGLRLMKGLMRNWQNDGVDDEYDSENNRIKDSTPQVDTQNHKMPEMTLLQGEQKKQQREHKNEQLNHQQQQQLQQNCDGFVMRNCEDYVSNVVSKALQSKLTPLAPSFCPSIYTTTTTPGATTETTTATSFHSYKQQQSTMSMNNHQISMSEQQFSISHKYLQQDQQIPQKLEEQPTGQQKLYFPQPFHLIQLQPQHQSKQISSNPHQEQISNLTMQHYHHLKHQHEQQRLLHLTQQQREPLHPPNCAQHLVDDMIPDLPVYTLGDIITVTKDNLVNSIKNNRCNNYNNNNDIIILHQFVKGTIAAIALPISTNTILQPHHLIPLQIIPLPSPPPPTLSISNKTHSLNGDRWPLVETPVYIDTDGEYHSFCPAHGTTPQSIVQAPIEAVTRAIITNNNAAVNVATIGNHATVIIDPSTSDSLSSFVFVTPYQPIHDQPKTATKFHQILVSNSPNAPSVVDEGTQSVCAPVTASVVPSEKSRALLQLEDGVSLPLQISGEHNVIEVFV